MNVLKRGTILILAFFMTGIAVLAQQVKFDRSNFPGKEAELTQALKNIEKGEDLFFEAEVKLTGKGLDLRYLAEVKKEMIEALSYFMKANDFNPSSAPLNLMIGKCYLYLENSKEALEYFERAKTLDEQTRDIDFLMGWCYQLSGDVDKALMAYDQAMKRSTSLATTTTITAKMKECRYAKSMIDDAMDVLVDNLDVVNTVDADFLPLVMERDEHLFFERFTDGVSRLYMSTRGTGGWNTAEPTGQTINISHAVTLTEVALISPKGDTIAKRWFTLNDDPRHSVTRYLAVAAVTADGNTAYFPGNRYSGFGGFDIYMSQRNKKGEWDRPRNLGDAINTPGDEYGVALSPDGKTLYFSSNGIFSMGGFDIFKSTFDGKRWSKAENLGYPINSMTNDVIYSVSEDGNRLYFSSSRDGGSGNHDIHTVNFVPGVMPSIDKPGQVSLTADAEPEPEQEVVEPETAGSDAPGIVVMTLPDAETSTAPIVELSPVDIASSKEKPRQIEAMPEVKTEQVPAVKTPDVQYPASLRGFITDNQSYLPVATSLKLTDLKNNTEENISTDNRGTFQTTLTAGNAYRLTVDMAGYRSYSEEFNVDATSGQKLSKYIKLEPLATAATTALTTVVLDKPEPAPAEATETENEDYEDILILSPLFNAEDSGERQPESMQAEHPVHYSGLLSNNRTFQPVVSALVKVTNTGTGDETVSYSDATGVYRFTVASGNSYTMTIESSGYKSYTENIVLPGSTNVAVVHPIQLTSMDAVKPVDDVETETEAETKILTASLMGDVMDNNDKPVANAMLQFTDTKTQATLFAATDANGAYTVMLPVGNNYDILLNVEGYNPVNDNITMPTESVRRLAKDFQLTTLAMAVEPATEVPVLTAQVTEDPQPEPVVEPEPVQPVDEPEEREVIMIEVIENVEPEPAPTEEPAVTEAEEPVAPEPQPEPQPVVEPEPVQPEPQPTPAVVDIIPMEIDEEVLVKEPFVEEPVEEPAPAVEPVVEVVEVVEDLQPVAEPEPVVAPQPEPEPVVEPEPVQPTEEPAEEPVEIEVIEVVEPQPEPEPVVEPAPQPVVKPEPAPVAKQPGQMTLAGTVTGTSKQPLNATVTITNVTQGIAETVTTDNKGAFRKVVTKGSDYSITVKADGYQNYIKDLPVFHEINTVNVPVAMKPLEGTLLVSVPFDFDRASLNDEAMNVLNNLLDALESGEKSVRIYGYSDSYGGDGYNTRLAERRLKAISSYLNAKGIGRDKISTESLGLNDPVATNLTIDGRKSNNRVEIWTK